MSYLDWNHFGIALAFLGSILLALDLLNDPALERAEEAGRDILGIVSLGAVARFLKKHWKTILGIIVSLAAVLLLSVLSWLLAARPALRGEGALLWVLLGWVLLALALLMWIVIPWEARLGPVWHLHLLRGLRRTLGACCAAILVGPFFLGASSPSDYLQVGARLGAILALAALVIVLPPLEAILAVSVPLALTYWAKSKGHVKSALRLTGFRYVAMAFVIQYFATP